MRLHALEQIVKRMRACVRLVRLSLADRLIVRLYTSR
jgi:hypothetical protein